MYRERERARARARVYQGTRSITGGPGRGPVTGVAPPYVLGFKGKLVHVLAETASGLLLGSMCPGLLSGCMCPVWGKDLGLCHTYHQRIYA